MQFTHIVIATFVVLVFCLYVDGELGQEWALWIKKEQDVKQNKIKSHLCTEPSRSPDVIIVLLPLK